MKDTLVLFNLRIDSDINIRKRIKLEGASNTRLMYLAY